MNLSRFFEHWKITENPFRGEEARHDSVFRRLTDRPEPDADRPARTIPHTTHSDFEKVLGEFGRPSTSIVFGEKGSGKTAMRMQLGDRLAEHNEEAPDARCLFLPYDDLNPVLDRFIERVSGGRDADVTDILAKFRLVDHIDAMLLAVVPKVVDVLLQQRTADGEPLDLGTDARRNARRLSESQRQDLLLLQATYDSAVQAGDRTRRLRKMLRLPMPKSVLLWDLLAKGAWVVPVAIGIWGFFFAPEQMRGGTLVQILFGVLALGYIVVLAKRFGWDRLAFQSLGRRVRKEIRVSPRPDASYAKSFEQLHPMLRIPGSLPETNSDDTRYAMLTRFRNVIKAFGFTTMIVVLDRIDEPTVISGDADRMQHVVWPLLNNKFLQQEGFGVKMLLPIELRHALYRESAAFFQEARLDKQNLVERLTWTGAMLYDLCNARVKACRPDDAEAMSLLDLFDEDVSSQDIVDALDQMHQPRDAFKMLYQCLTEHCSNVTEEQEQWRIPRLVLETVRKEQAERVRQLYRGVRPA